MGDIQAHFFFFFNITVCVDRLVSPCRDTETRHVVIGLEKSIPCNINKEMPTLIRFLSAPTHVSLQTMGGKLAWSGGSLDLAMNMVRTAISSLVKELIRARSLSFRYSWTISRPLTPSKTSRRRSWEPMEGHWQKLCRRTLANRLSRSCVKYKEARNESLKLGDLSTYTNSTMEGLRTAEYVATSACSPIPNPNSNHNPIPNSNPNSNCHVLLNLTLLHCTDT